MGFLKFSNILRYVTQNVSDRKPTKWYTKNPSDTNMGANEPRLCKTKALVKAFLVSSGR